MRPSEGGVGFKVSRETLDRLIIFEKLVRKWTASINLVSKRSLDELWVRHIVDSAQVFQVMAPIKGRWVDLGSGGGFPGAVVAILAIELAPELRVVCVESDQRKSTFLRAVSRETGANFSVVSQRIEDVPPLEADYLSARALAALPLLLELSERHLKSNGTGIFPKGESVASELTEARKNWRFHLESITSTTDPKSVLLKIGALTRA
ncbi:16S rRNA (guanine(527)-N(7))-methyltransferase RsmG [Pseudoruegeria sp. SK021]|nr:16S rRNA (guanine(527)-N(7))-methyltransferase RsmG [Pseudoruegeria sp. SK021]